MAFGPSITFVVPTWEPGITRSAEPKGNLVPVEPLYSWFRSLGFLQHPGPGTNFTRGPLDIYVHRVDEEVAFTTIEFGMVDNALEQLHAWEIFVQELCEKWGFSLTDQEKGEKVPVGQFRRILGQDKTWHLIAGIKKWPPIWSPTD